jgi:hypothetical protein
MMQSSGTSEGLRGLLDSSLLQSVKKVMATRNVFGANVLAIGVFSRLSACSYSVLRLASNQHYGDFHSQ